MGGGASGANPFEYAKNQVGGALNVGNNGGNFNPLNSEFNKYATGGIQLPNSDQMKGFTEGDYSGLQEWGTGEAQKHLDPRVAKAGSATSLIANAGIGNAYSRDKAKDRQGADVAQQQASTDSANQAQNAQQQIAQESLAAKTKADTDALTKTNTGAFNQSNDLESALLEARKRKAGRTLYQGA